VLLCAAQQHFGLLKLGNGIDYVLSAYPVSIQLPDVVLVLAVVLLLGALAAWIPARKITLSLLLVCCLATGCKHPVTPVSYNVLDSVLTSGQFEYYGPYYKQEGIDYDVICLDLYSKGVGLNKDGKMEGVGTNVYISDIFVPATDAAGDQPQAVLPSGTYKSDSTARLMHFLRGMNYDGNYGGSYVLLKGENNYSVILITDSEITIAYAGDTLILDGSASLEGEKKPYSFHYRNILPISQPAR